MVETGWGPLAVCDSHVHFFSHKFLSLLAAASDREGLTAEAAASMLHWQAPPEHPQDLAREWAAELDRHHVTRVALMASHPGDVESVASAIQLFPNRFTGYFMFDPTREDANAALALDRGFRCVCLFPALHHYSMYDPRVKPVFNECARQPGSAIFVHCGTLSIGVRRKLGIRTVYDARFSNPLDLVAIAQMHPEVPFLVPHFGAGMFREALLLAAQCPNVFLDTSSSNSWMAVEGLDMRTVFRRALDTAGPDRLLFGTDSSFFPRGWQKAIFDAQATALYELGLEQADAAKILGGNFQRLFSA